MAEFTRQRLLNGIVVISFGPRHTVASRKAMEISVALPGVPIRCKSNQ